MNTNENDYFSELNRTMTWLGEQSKTIMIGQSVLWNGHALYKSSLGFPLEKRIELPVFEDFQMGMSIGLAVEGFIPISIYPRFDFLIIATNQLLNHLANVQYVTEGKLKPRVIIRVSVGGTEPMHPGVQHCQDYTEPMKMMVRGQIEVVELKNKKDIFPEYKNAYLREDCKPTILIEHMNLYHTQGE